MLAQHMMLMRLKADGVGANMPANQRNGRKIKLYDVGGYGLMRLAWRGLMHG